MCHCLNGGYGETFEWRHAIDDWNSGSDGERSKGSRFYRRCYEHSELVKNLLMYGYTTTNSLDIATGDVSGVVRGAQTSFTNGFARVGVKSYGFVRLPVHQRK